jgi:hypothetical protein
MHISPRTAVLLFACAALAALAPARAGVVAQETTVFDLLQMLTFDTQVTTGIEGGKARVELVARIKKGRSDDLVGEGMQTMEIQRLDRGVVYSLDEAAHQYREGKLGGLASPTDPSGEIAAIASGLKCRWITPEVAATRVGAELIGEVGTTHERVDTSHRCAPIAQPGTSCTLGIVYDQWSTSTSDLHAQLARYRRDYAAKGGTGTGLAEAFTVFSQFGVPVDPRLLESIRTATASSGVALKTTAVLRASRSCFMRPAAVGHAPTTHPASAGESSAAVVSRYVGAMLLSAWLAEKAQSGGDAERPETLGTITSELKAIHARKIPESQFELPAGFTRVP